MFWQNSLRTRYTVRTITRSLKTQASYDSNASLDHNTVSLPRLGLATPRQLMEYLNQYIVGQEQAKKVLSVAVFNHYSRIQADQEMMIQHQQQSQAEVEEIPEDTADSSVQPAKLRPMRSSHSSPSLPQVYPHFEKSNVLVIGPTGSGKTLLAKTLAKVLDVPFSVSDATSFTQAGYVGEDVEMTIQRLLQAAHWDASRASMGIVYIDEIDKIARRAGSSMEGSRDVSGEGVQQALLRMMEGSTISIQAKGNQAEPQGGHGNSRSRGRGAPNVAFQPKTDVYHIDTSNVLFIVSGAFVGLESIIGQRVSKGRHSIGFSSSSKGGPLFFTSNHKTPENILESVDPADLVKYGFIPEFVSRLPAITTLAPLTIPDLRRILTGVKGSLLSQYKALFEYSNVEIRFTSAALDEICRQAYERGGGARGLRGIMEKLLLEPMYEVPGSDIKGVLITEQVTKGGAPPQYFRKSQNAVEFWESWAADETEYYRRKTS